MLTLVRRTFHHIKKIFTATLWVGVVLVLTCCNANSLPDSDISELVTIGSSRKIYLMCRGVGSPTVVLISGTGGASDEWTHVSNPANPNNNPIPDNSAVFGQVSKFTRVCAYDRPGTMRFDDTLAPSTPVSQPTSAEDGVTDLQTLLDAADVRGPYILVGASWGGMIAKLFASTHPNEVAGLVFVDSASEFLKTTLTPAQWSDWMNKAKGMLALKDAEVPDYESSIPQVRNNPLQKNKPTIVLTSDKPWDLQVGDTGSTWPAWLQAQKLLASQLAAVHISNTKSGHGIAIEQPQLVVEAIRKVVEAIRTEKPLSPN